MSGGVRAPPVLLTGPMPYIEIRKARIDEAQTLLDLRAASILALCACHYPARVLTAWANVQITAHFLEMLAGEFYVAQSGRRIVGCGMIDLDTGWIDTLFVSPELTNQGIGRQLLGHLETLACGARLQTLQLESTLNAAPFYQHLGFTGHSSSGHPEQEGPGLACIPMLKQIQGQISRQGE